MIKLCEQKDCTGCMACKQSCPVNAISTIEHDGFYYPIIDTEICIKCHKCEKSCPVLNLSNLNGEILNHHDSCFAAWSYSEDTCKKSSSGGIFNEIAKHIIESGGIVFASKFDAELNLHFSAINQIKDLEPAQRSKYVQSDTRETFSEVRNLLKRGITVGYCGTPCQIAGLKYYLGNKDYPNLITIDVVCQGVPSPVFFKKYIAEVESETHSNFNNCVFRSKQNGWRCGLLLLLYDNRNRVHRRILGSNEFYNAFLKNYFLRPACYQCRFKDCDLGYFSDITLADFWRINPNNKEISTQYKNGISAVNINTDKGLRIWKAITPHIYQEKRTFEEFSTNGGLYRASVPSNNLDAMQFLQNNSWQETQKRFFPVTTRRYLSVVVQMLIPQNFINKLKKLIK